MSSRNSAKKAPGFTPGPLFIPDIHLIQPNLEISFDISRYGHHPAEAAGQLIGNTRDEPRVYSRRKRLSSSEHLQILEPSRIRRILLVIYPVTLPNRQHI
jgi:hypothetical protein